MNIQEYRTRIWNIFEGDKKLRLDYPLNENSVVFDLGGYKGDWAHSIYSKYKCSLYIFEPVSSYYYEIKERFKEIEAIKVFNFGLGAKDEKPIIHMSNDATSIYIESAEAQQIVIKDINTFLQEVRLTSIDLMKINIEGSEYDLLDSLLESGKIKIIQNIQIQFHDFVPQSDTRALSIRESLSKTHTISYFFPYVWENWKFHPKKEISGYTLDFYEKAYTKVFDELVKQSKVSDELATELHSIKVSLEKAKQKEHQLRGSVQYKLGHRIYETTGLRYLIQLFHLFKGR